jgi:hypothetical protein
MPRDSHDVQNRVRPLLEAFRMRHALEAFVSAVPGDKPGRTPSSETIELRSNCPLRAKLDHRRERRIRRRLDVSHKTTAGGRDGCVPLQ